MKDKEIIILKEQLENWIDFNKEKGLHIIDISKLLTIIKQFYIIKPKTTHKKGYLESEFVKPKSCKKCGKRIFDIEKRICGTSWDYCACEKKKNGCGKEWAEFKDGFRTGRNGFCGSFKRHGRVSYE